MSSIKIGVLAFHGDVSEHIRATENAAKKLKRSVSVSAVRTKEELDGLAGLILPGGESTTLQKLCEREGMFPGMKRIKHIFGTCAGAILLAKHVRNKATGQKTLSLMDIEVERNAYGRQNESFQKEIQTSLGPVDATFIRAPKISRAARTVNILSEGSSILACEQTIGSKYYLALTFHPEFTTTLFHEYFLMQVMNAEAKAR